MANVPISAGGQRGQNHAGFQRGAGPGPARTLNQPVESRPRSWLWIRWMLSLAAISLPFSIPALERSDPDDCGCILVAEAYFSSMTEGRPCSVVFGVSSTIPLKGTEEVFSAGGFLRPAGAGIRRPEHSSPVHPELGGDPVKAQRHQRHVWDAFRGAGRRDFLYRRLQEAQVHLHRNTEQLHIERFWTGAGLSGGQIRFQPQV